MCKGHGRPLAVGGKVTVAVVMGMGGILWKAVVPVSTQSHHR
jgi:hypothetical protein